MSLFGTNKKQSNAENSKTVESATTTPNVPDWIANPSKTIAGNVGGFLEQGSGAYTPGISDLQNQAFTGASNLTSSPYFKDAGDALGGVGNVGVTDAKAAGILDNGLEQYYNPFKQQILNPALQDFDIQAQQTRAAQAAAAARNKAFQGSRYGIQEGQTEGELARGRAATEGGLLKDMYSQATGMAEADTGRRQQASITNAGAANQIALANQAAQLQKAQQLAGLATSQGADARANVALQGEQGGLLTSEQNAIKQYPLLYQQQMEGLLSGLNPELYTGKTLDSTSNKSGTSTSTMNDPMGDIGKIAQIAGIFMSDARAKRDVKTVGWDAAGRRWVTFSYLWAPLKRAFGVIAQEVAKSDPEAVLVGADGMLRVNYGRLR